MNFLSNAIKFTNEGRNITIRLVLLEVQECFTFLNLAASASAAAAMNSQAPAASAGASGVSGLAEIPEKLEEEGEEMSDAGKGERGGTKSGAPTAPGTGSRGEDAYVKFAIEVEDEGVGIS